MRHSVLAAAVFLCLLAIGPVLALRVPTKGTVNCVALNVRTGPSTSYQSLGTISNGTVVTILETSGSWYKVNTGSYQGRYVYASYIDVTDYEDIDEDQAAQRPHATLNQTDPNRPETRNIDPRVLPINTD